MRNIIITGGELFNKGAQAMTFVTVHELKKRFPEHEIYLLSEMDRQRPEAEKEQYAFSFTGWYPIKFARCQHNQALRLACLLRNKKELKECEDLYKNCDLMVDISGYGLGSNWDLNQLNTYLDHLEYAKAFGIPCYLMPQSFGPFVFSGDKKAIGERLPELLRSVKCICAREKEGYDSLVAEYGLQNVSLFPDLVLNNKGIELSRIYRGTPVICLPSIEENSVGIVPNVRTTEFIGRGALLSLYRDCISWLLEKGKRVYLLTHSTDDRSLCREISDLFCENNGVVFLAQDFSCIEYSEIVKRFDYVIASRYHSIIHAYKNCIPCISIGWAEKYNTLLRSFGQGQYCFDLRETESAEKIVSALEQMDAKRLFEAEKIKNYLHQVQEHNVFDILGSELPE